MWRFIPSGKRIEEWLQRRASARALREAEWLEEVERDQSIQMFIHPGDVARLEDEGRVALRRIDIEDEVDYREAWAENYSARS